MQPNREEGKTSAKILAVMICAVTLVATIFTIATSPIGGTCCGGSTTVEPEPTIIPGVDPPPPDPIIEVLDDLYSGEILPSPEEIIAQLAACQCNPTASGILTNIEWGHQRFDGIATVTTDAPGNFTFLTALAGPCKSKFEPGSPAWVGATPVITGGCSTFSTALFTAPPTAKPGDEFTVKVSLLGAAAPGQGQQTNCAGQPVGGEQTIKVFISSLDTDSDNNGVVEPKVDDAKDMVAPGKVICLNDNDDNQNGKPDLQDTGFADKDLTEAVLTFPALSEINRNIQIPADTPFPCFTNVINLNPTIKLTIKSGGIRVWKDRNKSELYLPDPRPGHQGALSREFPIASAPRTVFVEGVSSGEAQLEMLIIPDGSTDTVLFTVIKPNLQVANLPEEDGNANTPDELDPGAFLCVNDDFDELNRNIAGDLVADNDPSVPASIKAGDNELVAATLTQFPPLEGTWEISAPGGTAKVWWKNRQDQYVEVTEGGTPVKIDAIGGEVIQLLIEGIIASSAVRADEIKAVFTPAVAPMLHCEDTVKLTVVDMDIDIYMPKALDSTTSMIPRAEANSIGSVTFVNLDDDDKDGKFDVDDDVVDTGDDDLVKLVMTVTPADFKDEPNAFATIQAKTGHQFVRVWRQEDKASSSFLFGENSPSTTLPLHSQFFASAGDGLTLTMWVEAIAYHTAPLGTTFGAQIGIGTQVICTEDPALTNEGIVKMEWVGQGNSVNDDDTLLDDPNFAQHFPSGDNPGAKAVFPDLRSDDFTVGSTGQIMPKNSNKIFRDKVLAKVTISSKPPRPLSLTLKPFDVDDPSDENGPVDDSTSPGSIQYDAKTFTPTTTFKNEEEPEDNRGGAGKFTGTFVTNGIKKISVLTGQDVYTAEFQVTHNPGDNFRVVAQSQAESFQIIENPDEALDKKVVAGHTLSREERNANKQRIINTKKITGVDASQDPRDWELPKTDKLGQPVMVATPTLTVWRFLHLELDSMIAPVNFQATAEDPAPPVEPAKPASLGKTVLRYPDTSFLEEAFKPSYIRVKNDLVENGLDKQDGYGVPDGQGGVEFAPNILPKGNFGAAKVPLQYNLQFNLADSTTIRDVRSHEAFWVVQIVSAYEQLDGENSNDPDGDWPSINWNPILGDTPNPGKDMPCYIFSETIRDIAGKSGKDDATPTRTHTANGDPAVIEKRIVAHEPGHRFGIVHGVDTGGRPTVILTGGQTLSPDYPVFSSIFAPGNPPEEGLMRTFTNLTGSDADNRFYPLHLNGIRFQKIAQ